MIISIWDRHMRSWERLRIVVARDNAGRVRRTYTELRRRGVNKYDARFIVVDLIVAGRTSKTLEVPK